MSAHLLHDAHTAFLVACDCTGLKNQMQTERARFCAIIVTKMRAFRNLITHKYKPSVLVLCLPQHLYFWIDFSMLLRAVTPAGAFLPVPCFSFLFPLSSFVLFSFRPANTRRSCQKSEKLEIEIRKTVWAENYTRCSLPKFRKKTGKGR